MEYSRTIIHVDDDEAILQLVARCLNKEGIEVVSLTDPNEVIPRLASSGARIVISDIDMPEKDGLTLLREIKQCDAGIQVIMCTGMVSISTVLLSTSLGAETCIFKPLVDLSQVTGAVNRAFEKMDRWWTALHEWMKLQKSLEESVHGSSEPIAEPNGSLATTVHH